MADPKGINPPTPNTLTQSKDDNQEDKTSLSMKTVGDLKKTGSGLPYPSAWGRVVTNDGQPKMAVPPVNLEIGVQKALKGLNLSPGSIGAFAIDSRYSLPDSVKFSIPGYDGKWSLSVNQNFIGNGQGQIPAEDWTNVAKKLGQSAPLASPAGPQ